MLDVRLGVRLPKAQSDTRSVLKLSAPKCVMFPFHFWTDGLLSVVTGACDSAEGPCCGLSKAVRRSGAAVGPGHRAGLLQQCGPLAAAQASEGTTASHQGATALCPLPSALCPLPSALCPLPSALCPLPSALCPLPPAPCPCLHFAQHSRLLARTQLADAKL